MLKPMVGGTFGTVIFLTPGRNRSSVSVISGVFTLGRTPADDEVLAVEDFWAMLNVEVVGLEDWSYYRLKVEPCIFLQTKK